jgi:hypothetical protein
MSEDKKIVECQSYEPTAWDNCQVCGAPRELHVKSNKDVEPEDVRLPYKD